MTNSLFLEKSIKQIKELISKKEINSKDLFDNFLKYYQIHESKVHAWVRINEKLINLILESKEKGNFYNSIPFGVKDIFNTLDLKTEMGSETWKDHNPGNDARVISVLRRNGFVPIGKTVTAEFAVHHLNKTKNPHDLSKTPGTSSSGSAVAISTGMVPFALGTQTAGSIIRPASFCGVWGMKPSFGLIPRTGSLKTTDSLDTIGFLTSHGDNLKDILDVVRVRGPNYPFVFKNIDNKKPQIKKNSIKVGFIKGNTWNLAEEYAKTSFETFCESLSKNNEYNLEEINLNGSLENIHEIHSVIYEKSLGYYFKNESKNYKQVSKIMMDSIKNSKKIRNEDFISSLRKQDQLIEVINHKLDEYDFVICLSTSSSAPTRGKREIDDLALVWTLSHSPSISAPLFRCSAELPFGLQFVTSKYNDYMLLAYVEEMIKKGIIPSGSNTIRNTSTT